MKSPVTASDRLDEGTLKLKTERSHGSGVLVGSQSILTCAHVVRGIERVSVHDGLTEEKLTEATVDLRGDPDGQLDLALLTTDDPIDRQPIPFATDWKRGEPFGAIGFPHGDRHRKKHVDGKVQGGGLNGWLQVDGRSSEIVDFGFSGTAMWAFRREAAIGIVTHVTGKKVETDDGKIRRVATGGAYIITTEQILAFWPELPLDGSPDSEDGPLTSPELRAAYERRALLETEGADPSETLAINREIATLRKAQRGDRLHLEPGDYLDNGRFLLKALAGTGGFAEVWCAFDSKTNSIVAVKVLNTRSFDRSGDQLRRFLRGARQMVRLRDVPEVVDILEQDRVDSGRHFFVMEYVGPDLRKAVKQDLVDRSTWLGLTRTIGRALSAAHARHILHRDVKPTNILLDRHGQARLTDFDLVRAADTHGDTGTQVGMGTIVFAAPESLGEAATAAETADVFGLGMTAIFVLHGQDLPFHVYWDSQPLLASLEISTQTRRVLARAIARDVEDRWPSVEAFCSALQEAEAAAVSPATVERPPPDALPPSAPPAGASGEDTPTTPPPGPGVGVVSVRGFEGQPLRVSVAPEAERPPNRIGGSSRRSRRTGPSWSRASGRDEYGPWATFGIGDVEQRMRWIEPGSFWMGSPDGEEGRLDWEGRRHRVTLSEGFWLADTPCTQALWEAVMGKNPSGFVSPERPVEQVSWNDCRGFFDRIDAMQPGPGLGFPTEAQWEYACRAGTESATWLGDLDIRGDNDAPLLDQIAWYGGNSGVAFDLKTGYDSSGWKEKQHDHAIAGTRLVQTKAPNPWGLYDMLGNVGEWCLDETDWPPGNYPSEGERGDPVLTSGGTERVLRGGSWNSDARYVRAASRDAYEPGDRDGSVGFRLSRGPGAGGR